MARPQKYHNVRITKPVYTRNRKREDGRPVGTLKRYPFIETRLGFFLKYETPLEWSIIEPLIPPGLFTHPPIESIECVANASLDPSFKKRKFQVYLDEFKKKGLCQGRAITMTPTKARYYEMIRKNKMERFIESNRLRINALKKKLQINNGVE